jgi:hypothetical protein
MEARDYRQSRCDDTDTAAAEMEETSRLLGGLVNLTLSPVAAECDVELPHLPTELWLQIQGNLTRVWDRHHLACCSH